MSLLFRPFSVLVAVFTICLGHLAAAEGPVLDYKLNYKTTKKDSSIIGWKEFNPPTTRPPNFYTNGDFEGKEIWIQHVIYNPYTALWNGWWTHYGDYMPGAKIIAEATPSGWVVAQSAELVMDSDDGSAPTFDEFKELALNSYKSEPDDVQIVSSPPYEYESESADHVSVDVGSQGWAQSEVDPIDHYFFFLKFYFSGIDKEENAESRATEREIHPNPPPPPEPQPSSADLAKVGASFRALRTDRDFVRYSSQFNLKLKLCPGVYTLKWRVSGIHKDSTGTPQHFPQKKEITIDEKTPLDADGFYDLGWIDIKQEPLTPDYIYRLAKYAEGATNTFYIEPKDKCGCGSAASGGVGFGSVHAWFNLDKDATGRTSGYLELDTENIEANSHLPEALNAVNGTSPFTRFEYDENNHIKQAISEKTVIDIVSLPNPADGYQLKQYRTADSTGWTDGRFRAFNAVGTTPAPQPYAVWTVQKLPDAGGYKRLQITRTEGGKNFVHTFGQGITTSTNWTYDELGLRTTTRAESAAPDGDIYQTTTLSESAYGVASIVRKRLHTFAWGVETVEETHDPDGTHPLTTFYEFHTSGVGTGQLWKTTLPDGTVIENTYSAYDTGLGVTTSRLASTTTTYPGGRVKTMVHGTLEDLTANSADAIHSVVTSTESLAAVLIRRSWQVNYSTPVSIAGVAYAESRNIEAAATTTAWDSSANRVTITRTADTSEGRVSISLTPDGRISRTIQGLPDSNGVRLTTTESGPADSAGTGLLSSSVGTRTEVETDASGRTLSRSEIDLASGLTTALEQVTEWHATKPELPTLISYPDGSEEVRGYSPCCGKLETATRHGATVTTHYDDLGRQTTVTQNGITTESRYDAADRVRATLRYPAGVPGSAITQATSTYDPAGRLTATADALGRTTTYAETVNPTTGQTTTVTTLPADPAEDLLAGVRTEIQNSDGTTASITGNTTAPVSYAYFTSTLTDAAQWGYGTADVFSATLETKLTVAGAATGETVTTYRDAAGNVIKTVFADDATARTLYDAAGRPYKQVDPDGVTTLWTYETGAFGERTTTAIDLAATTGGPRNGTLDLAGHDRVSSTTTLIAAKLGNTIRRTTTEVWETAAADTPTTTSISEVSLDGLKTWQTSFGQTTATITTIATDGTRTETTTYPDNTQLIRTRTNGRPVSEIRKDANGQTIAELTYHHDEHGRLDELTQTGVGTTIYSYFDDDRIKTVTTPDPDTTRSGTGYTAQATTHSYNQRGWVKKVLNHDGTELFTRYYPNGLEKRITGARTYPVEKTYDAQGRLKTLTTWQNFATSAGAAVTTWNYDPERGWLTSKHDANDKGPSYTYTPAGRLQTRVWQRGITTTYGYTDAGDLETLTYSDGTTPNVSQTYTRDGRPRTTTDAAGLLTRTYASHGALAGEAYTSAGLLSGRALARTYDAKHRPQTLATNTGYGITYGFDDAGLLETLGEGFHLAKYAYKPNVGTVETVTIKRAGVERVRHQRTTDALGRVSQIKTITGALTPVQRDYTYNDANQRTHIDHEDTRLWAYDYDDLGQITSAQKRLADNVTPLPGYTFGYTFDNIGNRVETTVNSHTATYTPNLLNQYENRAVPGAVEVRGEARATATVTVNTQSTTRTGKDFYREVSAANGSAPVNTTITITASEAGETINDTPTAFLARTPESFVHDDDGNLKRDGRWTYTWDAENRLISMETPTALATAFPDLKKRLSFAYDAQSRRIRKHVETWNAALNGGLGGWASTIDLRFVYDGWNLLTELDALHSNAVVRSHVWGLDLSGTAQGAGGVGGLLWTNTATHSFAPSADANGNIVAYINTATLAVAGRADYGAFGEIVMQTGVAKELPFGFSTKYTDRETGLLYYGFRYYNPGTGRWPSRDPIAEQGGVNLYGMVGNNPVNKTDVLGLAAEIKIEEDSGSPGYHFTAEGYDSSGARFNVLGIPGFPRDFVGTSLMPSSSNYRRLTGAGTANYGMSAELTESINVTWPSGNYPGVVRLQPSGEVRIKISVRNASCGAVTISWSGSSVSGTTPISYAVFTAKTAGSQISGFKQGVNGSGGTYNLSGHTNSGPFKLRFSAPSSSWTDVGTVELGHQFYIDRGYTISAQATLRVRVSAL